MHDSSESKDNMRRSTDTHKSSNGRVSDVVYSMKAKLIPTQSDDMSPSKSRLTQQLDSLCLDPTAQDSSSEDSLGKLEKKQAILHLLLEAIRGSSKQDEDEILSLVRNAGSVQELESNLRRRQNTVIGTGSDEGDFDNRRKAGRRLNEDASRASLGKGQTKVR